ncbi:hypothetical protein IWW36_004837 [Coemansia brasiliensis]|uniref:NAD(P)-binding protein n=1 Tax=Coemansia brasiliensis TaxID=2650707 RepID=A0A9W8I2L2_9FUNG|nr:hypothetical protein IWW36_004837 [Coemansia brasiliensis]
MLGQILVSLSVVAVGYQMLRWMQPTPSVYGKKVVIVGASSGIGKSLALEYARNGARLILCARRELELSEVSKECSKLNEHTAQLVVGDITQSTIQQQLYDSAMQHFNGSIDYLVLNAGAITVQQVVDLWDMRQKDSSNELRAPSSQAAARANQAMRQVMEINAFAPITVASQFLPMLAKSQGAIVVVSSVAGLIAAPTRSLYTASKHAVNGFFSALRMEVQGMGIGVTIISPGTVDTELRKSAVDNDPNAQTPVSGSQRGKMSPERCARQILRAAALRQPSLVTPLPYWISVVLHTFAPGLIEYLARRKYGLP